MILTYLWSNYIIRFPKNFLTLTGHVVVQINQNERIIDIDNGKADWTSSNTAVGNEMENTMHNEEQYNVQFTSINTKVWIEEQKAIEKFVIQIILCSKNDKNNTSISSTSTGKICSQNWKYFVSNCKY